MRKSDRRVKRETAGEFSESAAVRALLPHDLDGSA